MLRIVLSCRGHIWYLENCLVWRKTSTHLGTRHESFCVDNKGDLEGRNTVRKNCFFFSSGKSQRFYLFRSTGDSNRKKRKRKMLMGDTEQQQNWEAGSRLISSRAGDLHSALRGVDLEKDGWKD